jgi:hypothetical protein
MHNFAAKKEMRKLTQMAYCGCTTSNRTKGIDVVDVDGVHAGTP